MTVPHHPEPGRLARARWLIDRGVRWLLRRRLSVRLRQGRGKAARFPRAAVPAEEIQVIKDEIRSMPDVLDCAANAAFYKDLNFEVLADPFTDEIAQRAASALKRLEGFSAIRIGDGEAHFLALDRNGRTPFLDRYCLEESILIQSDWFEVSEPALATLCSDMQAAVRSADVVGVLGLWVSKTEGWAPESVIATLDSDLRGIGGQWRGRFVMRDFARQGILAGRTVASAHLYFGLINRLESLINPARRVYLFTNQYEYVRKISADHPEKETIWIEVGMPSQHAKRTAAPTFLQDVKAKLPNDMRGCLCLIGAGPWAEIYCDWVKGRGGVALDIGSGFDLLAGKITRPVHKNVDLRSIPTILRATQ